MANRSLYYHSPNLFPIPLNLQDMGPLLTTLRYSDLIAVVYMLINLTHDNSGGVMVQWLGRRISDQGVPGSNPGRCTFRCGLEQVTFTLLSTG